MGLNIFTLQKKAKVLVREFRIIWKIYGNIDDVSIESFFLNLSEMFLIRIGMPIRILPQVLHILENQIKKKLLFTAVPLKCFICLVIIIVVVTIFNIFFTVYRKFIEKVPYKLSFIFGEIDTVRYEFGSSSAGTACGFGSGKNGANPTGSGSTTPLSVVTIPYSHSLTLTSGSLC